MSTPTTSSRVPVIGDTIMTRTPISYGQDAGRHLRCVLLNAEAVEHARTLVASGNWVVVEKQESEAAK